MHELHANEIVLLSYYIAAINIEAVFDEINGPDHGYIPFDGIVLTDTFESTERERVLDDDMFDDNDHRLKEQMKQPITVIISNPPYSVGQKNANDNNQNVRYPKLEKNIQETYVKNSKSVLSKGAYDSYIKAFRWASDRINDKGIIGFITNGSFLDSSSTDGFRASLYKEFNYLYIFNLRGNQRTQGEQSRKEGGKIFGSGSRAPIAISILIKDGSDNHQIFYHDIGDYLSRKEKLNLIKKFGTILNQDIDWDKIVPDDNYDWINQRDPNYQKYPLISGEQDSPFLTNAVGINTGRDAWVTGFSRKKVICNTDHMVNNYNNLLKGNLKTKRNDLNIDDKIKWTRSLKKKFKNKKLIEIKNKQVVLEMYRPYVKKWIYYNKDVVESPGQFYEKWRDNNFIIETTGRSSNKKFSSLISNCMPCLDLMEKCQGFMRYDNSDKRGELIPNHDNVNKAFAEKIDLSLDDTFAYVYGLLNSREYKEKYANDLKKDLARIPIVKHKEKYVEVGQKLMDLHLNYEEVPVYDHVKIIYNGEHNYQVKKMKFAKKTNDKGEMVNDEATIIFNDNITISNIPDKAYKYVVNGRSAIEWIMDQYQIKTDKKSGITDDPNDYSEDPKYIFNLLLRIINVSVQTVDLINELPHFEVEE